MHSAKPKAILCSLVFVGLCRKVVNGHVVLFIRIMVIANIYDLCLCRPLWCNIASHSLTVDAPLILPPSCSCLTIGKNKEIAASFCQGTGDETLIPELEKRISCFHLCVIYRAE